MELKTEWFTWLQTIGIVASLLFAAYQLRASSRSNKATNYLKLVELHRDLWKLEIDFPEISRPFDFNLKEDQLKLSNRERRFVSFLMLHGSAAFVLQKYDQVSNTGDFKRDAKEVLSFPAIRKFWEENKRLYDDDFVQFMDSCIKSDPSKTEKS